MCTLTTTILVVVVVVLVVVVVIVVRSVDLCLFRFDHKVEL